MALPLALARWSPTNECPEGACLPFPTQVMYCSMLIGQWLILLPANPSSALTKLKFIFYFQRLGLYNLLLLG